MTTMVQTPIIVSVLVAIAGCALLGVVTEKVAYKPLRNSGSLAVLITAIGVSYLLQNLFLILFGSAARTFPQYMLVVQYLFLELILRMSLCFHLS